MVLKASGCAILLKSAVENSQVVPYYWNLCYAISLKFCRMVWREGKTVFPFCCLHFLIDFARVRWLKTATQNSWDSLKSLWRPLQEQEDQNEPVRLWGTSQNSSARWVLRIQESWQVLGPQGHNSQQYLTLKCAIIYFPLENAHKYKQVVSK